MTKTARGQEINMAALIAANDETVAVSNVSMNARGDILGPGGEIKVPAQEVQKEYYEEKLNAPKDEIKTLDDLQEKVTGKKTKTKTKKETVIEEKEWEVIAERKFTRDGKEFVEYEYSDGSIEEKELYADKTTKK
jgi:hypothetical protein